MLEELWRWGWAIALAAQGVTALVVWGMRAAYVSRRELADELARRDEARSRELHEMHRRVGDLEVRQTSTEERVAAVPSVQSVHTIEVRLEQIAGDVRALGEAVRPLGPAVTRIQQHLMGGGGG